MSDENVILLDDENIIWPIRKSEELEIVFPSTEPVTTPQVEELVQVLEGQMNRREIQQALGLNDREHFCKKYLISAIEMGLVTMAMPDKPNSSKQTYFLTAMGEKLR